MPSPLEVIVRQSEKARLSESEQQALAKAQTRQRLLSIAGGAIGVGIGYFLSKRNKSIGMRGFMILFNGSFLYGLGNTYASVTNLKELSDEHRYPHIAAAMKDITREILRSRGVDPDHPELGQTRPAQHTIDLRSLPPSMTPEERAQTQSDDSLYHKFDNAPQNEDTEQPTYDVSGAIAASNNNQSAWDSIRKANSHPDNAWERLRRQQSINSSSQQQQNSGSENTALEFTDAWDKLNDNRSHTYRDDDGSSSSESYNFGGSALSSDDFPRSREDFEEASRRSTNKYGDTVYS
ncbi:hypothetical protein FBU59_003116 [Linderina macrospora]|uniref:Uncharacterized protein n=1 Tax=Linderina macrospora TaxID=4868 RepID=A0ACC1J964_9FUNG|nr:hypothetical protein FBU59_003116 [Linderina macrospora]